MEILLTENQDEDEKDIERRVKRQIVPIAGEMYEKNAIQKIITRNLLH
ncbi:MAG: hypothetical protein Q7J31_04025 [Syntrophales bacterium]|nr:hypothetical protein [Syntrophales bacterium]